MSVFGAVCHLRLISRETETKCCQVRHQSLGKRYSLCSANSYVAISQLNSAKHAFLFVFLPATSVRDGAFALKISSWLSVCFCAFIPCALSLCHPKVLSAVSSRTEMTEMWRKVVLREIYWGILLNNGFFSNLLCSRSTSLDRKFHAFTCVFHLCFLQEFLWFLCF